MELALDQGGFLFQGEAINDRQYMPLRSLREHELCRVTVPRPVGMAQALLHCGQYLMQSYLLVPPQLPEVVPAAVRGDFEQPGPHIGVFRQFTIALIGSEKRVLTEIFGFRRPVRQLPDVEVNLSVVLYHELREALVHSTALHALNLCSFWACARHARSPMSWQRRPTSARAYGSAYAQRAGHT